VADMLRNCHNIVRRDSRFSTDPRPADPSRPTSCQPTVGRPTRRTDCPSAFRLPSVGIATGTGADKIPVEHLP
jgi:hypothetical protein